MKRSAEIDRVRDRVIDLARLWERLRDTWFSSPNVPAATHALREAERRLANVVAHLRELEASHVPSRQRAANEAKE